MDEFYEELKAETPHANGTATKTESRGQPLNRNNDERILNLCLDALKSDADDYHAWVEVGMVIKTVMPGADGLDTWKGWSGYSEKYDEAQCTEKWKGFDKNGSLTLGTLIKRARDRGVTIQTGSGTRYRGPNEAAVAAGVSSETPVPNGTPESEFRTISQLYEMDTKNDPTCLLGNRFLCRGGSMLLVGQSGIGKSSITAQSAISWALGLDLFGLRPKQPHKSVIVQAENDDGDLSEEVQGVLDGLQLAHRRHELDDKVLFFRESARTADQFTQYVRGKVQAHRPDLFYIDPWLAFLGGDVSDQATVSRFLRNQLNPIAQEYGCAFILVHHTGKPPKEKKQQTSGDLAYLGIGSSDATNWARAILVLREVEDELYELRAVKRGRRAGLFETKTSNQPGDRAFIQHGETGIYWRAAGLGPGQDEVDAREEETQEVLDRMGTDAHRWGDIIDIIKKVLHTKARTTATDFFTAHVKPRLNGPVLKKYTVRSPESGEVRNQSGCTN